MATNLKQGIEQLKRESPSQTKSDWDDFYKILNAPNKSPYARDIELTEAGFNKPEGYEWAADPSNKKYSAYRYGKNGELDMIENPPRGQFQNTRLHQLRKKYLPIIENVDETLMNKRDANRIYDRWDNEKELEKYFKKVNHNISKGRSR